MPSIMVVMPIYGRKMQSVEAMRRLINTASYSAQYIAVGGVAQVDTIDLCGQIAGVQRHVASTENCTYWEALHYATQNASGDTLVVNVANDVLPGAHWLLRAIEGYNEANDTVVGFNGDGHGEHHACHFMISMKRIRAMGGWPIWYNHNFGDTEICTRAREQYAFYKAPWAILYHNHPVMGAAFDDVYHKGNATFERDRQMFLNRQERQWTF